MVCIYVFVLYFSRQGRRRNVQTLGKMTATGAITNTSTISQLTRQDGASRNLTITKIQSQEEFNNKSSILTSRYDCAVTKKKLTKHSLHAEIQSNTDNWHIVENSLRIAPIHSPLHSDPCSHQHVQLISKGRKFNPFLSESMFLLILLFSPHLTTASLSPRSKELATKWAPRFALYL